MSQDPTATTKGPAPGRWTSRRGFLTAASASLAYTLLSGPQILSARYQSSTSGPAARDEFAAVRGVNYYPSWTRSLPDLWTHYDPGAVQFELGLARTLGFNSVRVWLGTDPWQKLGSKMWDHFSHFLTICQNSGLSVLPVLFDSCGVEPADYTGEIVTIAEAYRRAMDDPRTTEDSRQRMRVLASQFVKSAGQSALCPYSPSDPSTILWQWHAPSPGYSQLGPEHWSVWEYYLHEALHRFGEHPGVLAWDLMNEPNCIRIFNVRGGGEPDFDQSRVYRFIEHMRGVADTARPRQPITLGFEGAEGMHQMASHAHVLSFHSYEADPTKMEQILNREKAFAATQKKSLLLTETAAVLFVRDTHDTSDAVQLELYQKTMPLLGKAGIGYYMVALMTGRFPFAWVGFFRPDGSRKPVADYIESVLTKG